MCMKIKNIKRLNSETVKISIAVIIAGALTGNLLFDVLQEKEYWLSEQSYNEYLDYESKKNIATLAYYVTSVEDDKEYPVYEFPVGQKYVYDYCIQEYYYNGDLITKKTPIYDFISNKPLVEPELVEASDGKLYLQAPDYYLDSDGNTHVIEGSALENVEEILLGRNDSKVKIK